MDALPGGVQQLWPGLGQGRGRRASSGERQVLGDALDKDKPVERARGPSMSCQPALSPPLSPLAKLERPLPMWPWSPS